MADDKEVKDSKQEVKKLSPVQVKIKELEDYISSCPPANQMGTSDKAILAEKRDFLKFLKSLGNKKK